MPFIVAIDGPAGAGKSTVSKLLARRLGFALVDTGAIYRCVALAAARAGIALDDDPRLAALVAGVNIAFRFEGEVNHVFLGGEDVTTAIRAPEVSMGASAVSARPVVRDGLLDLQRRLARSSTGAVLEGRDIGTVVFPDADAKFFLTASAEMRARRRYDEMRERGDDVQFEDILADQKQRDFEDSNRPVAPLRQAADAVLMESTGLDARAVVDKMERIVRQRGG